MAFAVLYPPMFELEGKMSEEQSQITELNVNRENQIFEFSDHFAMWFSLGVGLLVIQMGSFLVGGIGTKPAIFAIIFGSIIGAGLLAYGARLGQETGLNSAGLIMGTFGTGFGKLPILLNIFQLIGWTAFELVIITEGTQKIGEKFLDASFENIAARLIIVSFWCGLLFFMLNQKMVSMVKKIGAKIALPLVCLSLLWLSFQFISRLDDNSFAAFWNASGDNKMSFFSAMDLVIAMPISWLPLVADYSRFGKSANSTTSGTWIGYAIANIWCYSLGFLIASTAPTDAGMVATILLAQGGLIALGIILLDEIDNAYGDAYSGTQNIGALLGKISHKHIGIGLIAVCGLAAVFLPMHDLEGFLILLSSIFIPLFAIIFGNYAANKIQENSSARQINMPLATLWVLGIIGFHILRINVPQIGAALPCFIVLFAISYLTSRQRRA